MATEELSNVSVSVPAVTEPTAGNPISQQTADGMLDVLDSLLNHTHIFYDDYGTACNCNCNCNCNCTRGSL